MQRFQSNIIQLDTLEEDKPSMAKPDCRGEVNAQPQDLSGMEMYIFF